MDVTNPIKDHDLKIFSFDKISFYFRQIQDNFVFTKYTLTIVNYEPLYILISEHIRPVHFV